MKKRLMFIALALLSIISTCLACTTSLKDYVSFENTQLGYKIQYPDNYIFIENSMTADEKNQAINSLPYNMRGQVPDSTQAIWFMPYSGEFYGSNIALFISSAPDAKQQDLKSTANQEKYEADALAQYSSILSGFTITRHMTGRTLGSQYFIIYDSAYTVGDAPYYMAQAITIWGGIQYTFTFTTNNPNTYQTAPFTTILSTLNFTK